MNQKQHTSSSFSRKVLYTLLSGVLLFVIAELITSVFYYHQFGKRKLALVELYHNVKDDLVQKKETTLNKENNYSFQQMIRPDSHAGMNREVYDEMMANNQFIYEPWVELRQRNYTGKYLNTKGFERKTIPSLISHSGKDTVRIWFFGGSTMFGFNVTDAETIPSQFAQLYRDSVADGPSVEIINYGIPYYYSYQELSLLTNLLFQKTAPDAVVFLDGLNDILQSDLSIAHTSANSSEIYQSLLQKEGGTNESTFSCFVTSGNRSLQQLTNNEKAELLIRDYNAFMKNVQHISNAYSFTPFFIWQPVPYYNYPGQMKDPICTKEQQPLFQLVFPQIKTIFTNHSNSLYLGDLLTNEKGLPFADKVHYSPKFNYRIASLILQKIKPSL